MKLQPVAPDIHSYSTPNVVRARHLDLDLAVHFDRKTLDGTATWSITRLAPGSLVLDTGGLKIQSVEAGRDGAFAPAPWKLGTADPILGAPLSIDIPESATAVRIRYETSPEASALQWLDPAQTAGKRHPFLLTQSQAIHARTVVPCQDSPGVRITFAARIHTPPELLAVMGAEMEQNPPRNGDYRFRMPEPIPSYLLALAVGDLDFRPTGKRTGVYAERPVVDRAAREFEDTERMVEAAEHLYGPYRWGRYDVLVLPPSFPFGGMENPRLTFVTPTILAGDKSLVALVAHELAHSWAGNLVTNATWSDFWLNEGFTVYLERRILEEVYGPDRAGMEAVLGRQDLEKDLARLPPRDQVLHIDLAGRDPDDGATDVPYEKGCLLLKTIAEPLGQRRFDEYLRGYFEHFAFESITTRQSIDYLKAHLGLPATLPLEDWLNGPGLPSGAFQPKSAAFAKVDTLARDWNGQPIPASANWSTQEWLHFLRDMPSPLAPARMALLDQRFHFTRTGNDEILAEWLEMAVRNRYQDAWPRLEEFLITVGRRKYVKPLMEALTKTPEGRAFAERVYRQARPGYHPITQTTVDAILK